MEEEILSFMSITELPIDEARQRYEVAGSLAMAIQNFYEAGDINEPMETPEVRTETISREYSQIVEEESGRNIVSENLWYNEEFISRFTSLSAIKLCKKAVQQF